MGQVKAKLRTDVQSTIERDKMKAFSKTNQKGLGSFFSYNQSGISQTALARIFFLLLDLLQTKHGQQTSQKCLTCKLVIKQKMQEGCRPNLLLLLSKSKYASQLIT